MNRVSGPLCLLRMCAAAPPKPVGQLDRQVRGMMRACGGGSALPFDSPADGKPRDGTDGTLRDNFILKGPPHAGARGILLVSTRGNPLGTPELEPCYGIAQAPSERRLSFLQRASCSFMFASGRVNQKDYCCFCFHQD